MKNTRLFLNSVALTALLFSSLNTEAKSNFSNKESFNEDKIKATVASNLLPAVPAVVEAPLFSKISAFSAFEKYSPEQLNTLIGVWPARLENTTDEGLNTAGLNEISNSYSPEQLISILGLNF